MRSTPPPHLPEEVDGIFIGGGHNSLIAAAYLARSGLDVLVLEANDTLGGGVTTEEITLPLFRHNLHAFFVRWTSEDRIWRDLDLDRCGVGALYPDVQNAVPFDGGQDALLTYKDVPRSLESIKRLSPADSQTYEQLYREYGLLVDRIDGQLRFSAPLPEDELSALLQRTRLGRRYLDLAGRSALDIVLDAFESEPLRSLILFNVSVRGYLPNIDVPGTGYCAVLALYNSHGGRMIAGGSREMATALVRAVYHAGGRVASRSRVESVTIRDGRARGVETIDGRRVRARRFVASSVPADQTLLDLVGPSHLDPSLADAMRGHRGLEEGLFGAHFALSRRPRFAAEARHPDLPRALNIALGYETHEDLLVDMEAINRREVPDHTAAHTTFPTVNDASQAPAGAHTAIAWQFVAGREPDGRDRVWQPQDDDRQMGAIVKMFERYAPDFADCVIASAPHSPTATAKYLTSMPRGDRHHGSYHPDNWGANRPHPSLSDYRTPVEGLYLCGASQHPGGSFTGGPGFNAAGAIADDLGVKVWWERTDARDALSALED